MVFGWSPFRTDERWSFETGGPIHSSPSVVDGTVYVGSYDGGVYAVDAADGRRQWRFDAGTSVSGSPTVVGDTVVVAVGSVSAEQRLYGLDVADGSQRWTVGLSTWSEPVGPAGVSIPTETVFVNRAAGRDGVLSAIDAREGDERWTADLRGVCTVIGDRLYVTEPRRSDGVSHTRLTAVDISDGSVCWHITRETEWISLPTVADGALVFNTPDAVSAVDIADGDERWSWRYERVSAYEVPTVADDTVFVGVSTTSVTDSKGGVHALDLSNGTELWQSEKRVSVSSTAPTVADGTVFVGSVAPHESVYGFDMADGSTAYSFRTDGPIMSSPIMVDGILFVGSSDTRVYGIDVPNTEDTSHDSRVRQHVLNQHDAHAERMPSTKLSPSD